MNNRGQPQASPLPEGATVAVVGGGPAGAFFALHLLQLAQLQGRTVRVVVFERRYSNCFKAAGPAPGNWRGCNYCAGGLSPRLLEALRQLRLELPAPMIQGRIRSITIQGYWKNIEIDVPEGKEMLTVYRGSQPATRPHRELSFDSFLLDQAIRAGARLIGAEVNRFRYNEQGKPLVCYRVGETPAILEADFVVVAAGVNESPRRPERRHPLLQELQSIMPDYAAPRLRSALILELELDPRRCAALDGQLHFVEYGSKTFRLEMCSLVPKRGYITAVLVGKSIDRLSARDQYPAICREFLALPHIRKLIVSGAVLRAGCLCNPNLVVGTAQNPVGNRFAVVGDMATSRLYKDGILSAHDTAQALAKALMTHGLDPESVRRGYLPVLRKFRRDNRFAAVVLFLHRIVFSSSGLSRVLYQAVITERKNNIQPRRRLERLLWQLASGDAPYEEVFYEMLHPGTVWKVLMGGLLLTFRNYLTELCFGLRWEGFGRFTTGVAKERLELKRAGFARLMAQAGTQVQGRLEFERMYTIKIMAPRHRVFEQLGRFGEADRAYLKPRWLRVERVAGMPNEPGCVIRYTVLNRSLNLNFHLVLEQAIPGELAVYRVRDGFAQGGVLVFEIEEAGRDDCALSIYVAFQFHRGRHPLVRPFWLLFRCCFPAFAHDVVWNHSLCVLKDVVETEHQASL